MNNDFWKYYALFDKNQYIDEIRTSKELQFIKKNLPIDTYPNILDVACGSGRISIPLSKYGYNITGIDNSNEFINEAKDSLKPNLGNINFIKTDYRKYSALKLFDAAIFIYSSFGYFSDNENIKLLKIISKSLKRDGIIILDNLNYYWVKNKPEGFWKDLTKRFNQKFLDIHGLISVKRLRILTKDDCYEKTTYKVKYKNGKIKTASFKQRIFNKQGMSKYLKMAGYKPLNFFGDFDQQLYSKKSPRIIAIAKKIT